MEVPPIWRQTQNGTLAARLVLEASAQGSSNLLLFALCVWRRQVEHRIIPERNCIYVGSGTATRGDEWQSFSSDDATSAIAPPSSKH